MGSILEIGIYFPFNIQGVKMISFAIISLILGIPASPKSHGMGKVLETGQDSVLYHSSPIGSRLFIWQKFQDLLFLCWYCVVELFRFEKNMTNWVSYHSFFWIF